MTSSFRLFIFTVLFLICGSQLINAQLFLKGTAPLKPGNYWKYYITDFWTLGIDSASFLVTDSIININNQPYYIVKSKLNLFDNFRLMGISSNNFYITYDESTPDSIFRYHKKTPRIGDEWSEKFGQDTVTYSVVENSETFAFGKFFNVKSVLVSGHLIAMGQLWNDTLGLMYEYSEAQYSARLSACVVDGVIYGDTSMYVTKINDEEPSDKNFVLYGNYPNPFNPSTTISYYLPKNSFVTIKIYNTLGEELKTLLKDNQAQGQYSINFTPNDLSSGIYIYTFQADNFYSSKKMLLLK